MNLESGCSRKRHHPDIPPFRHRHVAVCGTDAAMNTPVQNDRDSALQSENRIDVK
jgi:hypothetical protein